MISNLEKYKDDLKKLIEQGRLLYYAIVKESLPAEFEKQYKSFLKAKKYGELLKKIPNFRSGYQLWYSESLSLLKQILPDRVNDFVRLYEKAKNRKDIEYWNYVIEDYLQNLTVTRWYEKKVGPEAAITQFEQQLNIVKAIEKRFESSLFDIQQLVQADIFDSELAKATELNKKGFVRWAWAIAGVVLEKHLHQVCVNHKINMALKNPTISDYNDLLKSNDVYEIAIWRKIQFLGDLRNLCDHNKKKDPKVEEVDELIDWVAKIIKTIF